jgi:hypothetical protein
MMPGLVDSHPDTSNREEAARRGACKGAPSNRSFDRRPRSEFDMVSPVIGAAPVNSVVMRLRCQRAISNSLWMIPTQNLSFLS